MMAVIYSSTTGEVLRQIDGPERIFEKQNLSPNERLLSEADVDDWPDSFENRQVNPDTETIEFEVTLSELQSRRIQEVKERAQDILAETDWYVTREQETGESIPQDVLDHRATVRSQSDSFEQDITNLETVDDVMAYSYSFPSPPDSA